MKQLMMINRATLSSKVDADGKTNIIGWDEAKTKVFIPKHLVTDAILDLFNDDSKLEHGNTLYVCADEFSYQSRDEAGELIVEDGKPVMFTRLDAVAINSDFAPVAQVYNSAKILAKLADIALEDSVKSFKLSKTTVKDLIGAAAGK